MQREDTWVARVQTYGMKNSSGSSSSTYLNLRSGSLFNLLTNIEFPAFELKIFPDLSLGNWLAPCLTTSWTSSTVNVRPFLSCTWKVGHVYIIEEKMTHDEKMPKKMRPVLACFPCAQPLLIGLPPSRRMLRGKSNFRHRSFLTWVKTCCLKQFPLIEKSINKVWVVLRLVDQAGVHYLQHHP